MKADFPTVQNWITDIVRGLVDHPDEVIVRYRFEEDNITYSIFVHVDDVGKVFGKNRETLHSIQLLAGKRAGDVDMKRLFVQLNAPPKPKVAVCATA